MEGSIKGDSGGSFNRCGITQTKLILAATQY